MGGKNSGRNPKENAVLIEELRDAVISLNSDVEAVNKKVNLLTSRMNYWLNNQIELLSQERKRNDRKYAKIRH